MLTKLLSKVLGEKKQWNQYKARVEKLPASYRTAVEALERYLMYSGLGGDSTDMFTDLVELFEQGAASQTPVRQIVGEDPIEFIEAFVLNYPKGQWLLRERERLTQAIARATEAASA